MKIKFWGVRGSIPCPGPKTVKYGGNTSCIELRINDPEKLIIIDAGSGIRELGNHMMAVDIKKGPLKADIFFSHTHWDHIMGFPFFTPVYIPGSVLNIYGPVTYEDEPLENVVSGQMTYRYFPVRQAELASKRNYKLLKEEQFELDGGVKVTTKYLNHPIIGLGYKFECNNKIFCTVYDTEPYQNIFCTNKDDPSYDEGMAQEGEQVAKEENQNMESFIKDADLVVYDAQYTEEEYKKDKRGWGHTPIEYSIDAAKRNNVKRLALFHHDPLRTDDQLDELAEKFCKKSDDSDLEVFFAREMDEIEI